jgi:predicted Rossmann-fold nucleotide-binding protein
VLDAGNINPEDLDLMHVVDDPEEACAIINNRYRDRVSGVHHDRRDKRKKGV